MDKQETPVEEQAKDVEMKPVKKPNAFLRALGFDAVAKQTTIRTEIIAGIVTFLAMAYILTVNPNQILFAGVREDTILSHPVRQLPGHPYRDAR